MAYLAWINIYLAIFYWFYWLFLRKETFFQLNRCYFIASIFLSFLMPALELKEYFNSKESVQLLSTLAQEVYIGRAGAPTSVWSSWMDSYSVVLIMTFVYALGCLVSLISLLYRCILIKRKLKTSYPGQAYSFFHYIRVSPNLLAYSTIVEHESVHVKHLHSLDILLVEIVKVFNWFNPTVYWLHRSIQLNHEYIADEIVSHRGKGRISYAQTLLSHAFGTPVDTIANNFFNQSFIKKRIIMLFKSKSKRLVLSRFFILIPVLLASVAFQSKEESAFDGQFQSLRSVDPVVSEVIKETPMAVSTKSVKESSSSFKENIVEKLVGQSAKESLGSLSNERFEAVKLEGLSEIAAAQEQDPVPPGGMVAFLKYIGGNYVIPEEAIDAKVKGRMVFTFIVEKDGSISEVESVRDLGFGTKEEAIRLLENSENWTPGKKDGQVVRTQYTLPIVLDATSGEGI